MKKKLNTSKVFIFTSILFLSTLTIIFGSRFIYYYMQEHKTEPLIESNTTIYDYIMAYLNDKNKIDNISTFKKDDKTNEYYFYGNAINNYVNYLGLMWRIVSVDENKNIKLITDDTLTTMIYSHDDSKISFIDDWLNNKDDNVLSFIKLLDSDYLNNNTICTDEITSEITCNIKENSNLVNQISLYEYNRSGKEKGFLNINKKFWISSRSDSDIWYANDNGTISKIDPLHHYGVRPVITIKNTTINGIGTKESPITILKKDIITLQDANINSYLKYNNSTWKIINKTNNSVKIISNTPLKEKHIFSSDNNTYTIKKSSNIGYYLNNEYYETLDNKDYIVKENFYIGQYKTNDYNYLNLYNKNIKCNIGLPMITDLFINDYKNALLINGLDDNVYKTIYSINGNNQIYADKIENEYEIYPVLYLDNKLLISNGNGTSENPYEISR